MRDDRGSGIVTVIISVSFVAMLGVSLLFLTYMNAQINQSDLRAHRNFYRTEEAVDLARGNLQNAVSAAIEAAYTAALADYQNAEETFRQAFVIQIKNRLGAYSARHNSAYSFHPSESAAEYITVSGFEAQVLHNGYQDTISTDFEIQIPQHNGNWNLNELIVCRNWSKNEKN